MIFDHPYSSKVKPLAGVIRQVSVSLRKILSVRAARGMLYPVNQNKNMLARSQAKLLVRLNMAAGQSKALWIPRIWLANIWRELFSKS